MIQVEVIRLSPWWERSSFDPATQQQLDGLRNGTASSTSISESLKLLTQTLAESSGKLPLLLIDEYDTPIHGGGEHGFFKEVVGFFRNFLSAGLKDNRFLWKGVLTGILRVSKGNLFSGLNNITVFSLTDTEFAMCFGLREREVENESAHQQIVDKQYATELRAKGCARVIQWGIVSAGKETLVSVREG